MTVSALRAVTTLGLQRMPLDEIRAVLTADDPEIARRYLELHEERLAERYAEEREAVARLARSIGSRQRPCEPGRRSRPLSF
jgi:hypothetical protein